MNDGKQSVLSTLTLILQLGITMLVPIVALTVFGAYLGRHFGASWIPVVMFVLGSLGGMQGAWRIIKGVIKDWSVDPVSEAGLREAKEKQGEGAETDK